MFISYEYVSLRENKTNSTLLLMKKLIFKYDKSSHYFLLSLFYFPSHSFTFISFFHIHFLYRHSSSSSTFILHSNHLSSTTIFFFYFFCYFFFEDGDVAEGFSFKINVTSAVTPTPIKLVFKVYFF